MAEMECLSGFQRMQMLLYVVRDLKMLCQKNPSFHYSEENSSSKSLLLCMKTNSES
ncbi:hypothetical protein LINGRAHAP2_LOCUS22430 [Linum grandiflorum]